MSICTAQLVHVRKTCSVATLRAAGEAVGSQALVLTLALTLACTLLLRPTGRRLTAHCPVGFCRGLTWTCISKPPASHQVGRAPVKPPPLTNHPPGWPEGGRT